MGLSRRFFFPQCRTRWKERQGANARRSWEPTRPASKAPDTAAAKVAAVYRFLEKPEATTDWLARLHGMGAATGVQILSARYKTQPAEGDIVRYEIVLPVSGSYLQIRDFLKRSLAEIPVLSLDQLSLKREGPGAVQAELRLTLHMVKS